MSGWIVAFAIYLTVAAILAAHCKRKIAPLSWPGAAFLGLSWPWLAIARKL